MVIASRNITSADEEKAQYQSTIAALERKLEQASLAEEQWRQQCEAAKYGQSTYDFYNISRQEKSELQAQIAANSNSSDITSSALQEAHDTISSLHSELKQMQETVELGTKSEADLQAQIASIMYDLCTIVLWGHVMLFRAEKVALESNLADSQSKLASTSASFEEELTQLRAEASQKANDNAALASQLALLTSVYRVEYHFHL